MRILQTSGHIGGVGRTLDGARGPPALGQCDLRPDGRAHPRLPLEPAGCAS